MACHATCKTCARATRSSCLECPDNRSKAPGVTDTVEGSCPPDEGYFENDKENPGECDDICVACKQLGKCTKCKGAER